MAWHALQQGGGIQQAFDAGIGHAQLAQLRVLLQRALQRHVQLHWNQLGNLVGFLIGVAQHPAHIADDTARGHGSEGNDLRHMVMTVLVRHIVNHFLSALITQVDVQIRQ